jgi:hypothetical protein
VQPAAGAEGERLHIGVADRWDRPASFQRTPRPPAPSRAAQRRGWSVKGLARGEFEELLPGGAKQAVQAAIQERALCIGTIGVAPLVVFGEHLVDRR